MTGLAPQRQVLDTAYDNHFAPFRRPGHLACRRRQASTRRQTMGDAILLLYHIRIQPLPSRSGLENRRVEGDIKITGWCVTGSYHRRLATRG
jgi:hypothetical protein